MTQVPSALMLVQVPAAVLLLTLPVLWFARRGRRVDDHPLCRRCGFDLFGKPAESTRCNECGADLNRRRAVRVGNRQTRRRLMAAVLPISVLSAGWLGVLGYGTARGSDWNRSKPVWWLVADLESRDLTARPAAAAELDARVADGRLAPDAARALVDQALARQADPDQEWAPGYGLLLERLHAGKRLARPDWQRYLAQAVRLRADPLPASEGTGKVTVRLSGRVRVGTDNRFAFHHGVYGEPLVGGRAYRAADDPAPVLLVSGGPAGTQADVTLTSASGGAPPAGGCPVEIPVRVMVDPNGIPPAPAGGFGRGPDPEYRSILVLRATLAVPPPANAPGAADVAGVAAKEGRP